MRYITLIVFITLFSSCDYFKKEEAKTPVIRVNDSYLYEEDLRALLVDNTSETDSTLIVQNYIERWATKQLLLDKAKINIPKEELEDYNKLVQEYKSGLYAEAYKNIIVLKQLDSTISVTEYENFYNESKENFKLNDELLQLKYIHLPVNHSGLSVTKQKFNRFSQEDQQELEDQKIQFITHNFNDSLWIKRENLEEVIAPLYGYESAINKGSKFQLEDSLGVYLLSVKDILKTNDIAPLVHIKPTLKQIILNKRKLALLAKFEKDILTDAIKNNDFETY